MWRFEAKNQPQAIAFLSIQKIFLQALQAI